MSLSLRNLPHGKYKVTRFVPWEDPGHFGSSINPWENWNNIPAYEGGLLGEIIRREQPTYIPDLNHPEDDALGNKLAKYRSLLANPLFDDGQALNWAIALVEEPNAFTDREVEEYLLRTNLIGGTVRHVRTAQQLRQANEYIQREMNRIGDIQRALLPESLPDIPGLSIAADYQTFDTAGGDIYGFYPFGISPNCEQGDPRWAILMGDVAGHGPSAAVVMAMLHSILSTFPTDPEHPGDVLEYANRHLADKQIESAFVTAFLGFYNPNRHTLQYARAGHPPALVFDSNSHAVFQLDDVGNVPLGIIDHVQFEFAEYQLKPGQTVILYTDGITEAKNPAGEMFGVEGIQASLADCSGAPDCAINHIKSSLVEFEAGVRPKDDQALLVFRRDG
jgi:serine phosphatase RsbU (regulator of sigma subunit)